MKEGHRHLVQMKEDLTKAGKEEAHSKRGFDSFEIVSDRAKTQLKKATKTVKEKLTANQASICGCFLASATKQDRLIAPVCNQHGRSD